MNEMVIETWNLTKQYDGKAGCKDISLQVPRGVVYGFLGPNGAGKSTFVRTMLGLIHPTGGRAEMLGRPIGDIEARQSVGYLPELFRYQEWLTGRQLLDTHAELAKVPRPERKKRVDDLIERVGLNGRENEKIRGYSKGMQQRIGLAAALISNPDLIFLDEPTSALDPIGRREVRDLMAELRREGKTVFLNSHLLSEVETVCDHVAIIHKSELIVQGEWRKLTDVQAKVSIRAGGMTPAVWGSLEGLVTSWEPLEHHALDGTGRFLLHLTAEEQIPELVNRLSQRGVMLYELLPTQPHLEDVFLYWVNRKEQEHVLNRQAIV
ncbi:multidrug ABC transporter ATP-binding protein [Tumebacillus algifaecis]|uniref:Multidrug ABC transporter ATP-binding protein n=1 Tax=Tumebacillus algifaecis TaxID=1214604 RepID=A0A223D5W9_9BACL|nr:ABC transporter ATP-binding protein [Tumebacillus algifaecis]ASS76982.1 multidrug ABC transporter ATP-binding protein [Tumebacillus algifaecis]